MELKTFESNLLNVNLTMIISEDGAAYFKANDVADVLGYENSKHAIQNHVWEINKFNLNDIQQEIRDPTEAPYTLQGLHPQTTFLNEAGVY